MSVDNLFNEACKKKALELKTDVKSFTKKHGMVIAGSTNLTSDYDCTVNGPYCSDIIEIMFDTFYKRYGTTIDEGFDTNLYPGSGSLLLLDSTRFYGKTINKKNFLVVDHPKKKGKKFLLTLGDKRSLTDSYNWVFCKLCKAYKILLNKTELDIKKHNEFIPNKKYFVNGKNLSSILDTIFCSRREFKSDKKDILTTIVKKLPKNIDNNYQLRKSIFNYSIQTSFGKELDKFYRVNGVVFPPNTVGGKKFDFDELKPYIDSILGYSGLINWMCSEAYYTNYAVYAVVVCLQLGYNGKGFNKHVWLVACIENLADLINHLVHVLDHMDVKDKTESNIKKTLLTFSKYKYRIHFCLMHYYNCIKNKAKYMKENKKFNNLKKAIARRKDFDLVKANKDNVFGKDCLDFSGKYTIHNVKQWLKKQAKLVMDVVKHTNIDFQEKSKRKSKRKFKRKQSKKTKKKNNFKNK